MLIDHQIKKPALGPENANSWPLSGRLQTNPFRRFQSHLTDEQLAQNNLMVVNVPQNVHILKDFLDSDISWGSSDTILIHASSFEGLAKEIEPAIAAPQPEATTSWWSQFESRLADLREAAVEEEISVSEDSLSTALRFAKTLHAVRAPSTFLLGNGNVRLLWDNNDGEQIGLQFRSDKRVQYVFFKKAQGQLEQMMGTKLASGILELIGVLGLRHVISA